MLVHMLIVSVIHCQLPYRQDYGRHWPAGDMSSLQSAGIVCCLLPLELPARLLLCLIQRLVLQILVCGQTPKIKRLLLHFRKTVAVI